MKEVFLTSSYLAPVSWYTALIGGSTAFVEQYDHYMKQTYRNRCVLMGAQGRISLTIPVEKSVSDKCLMKDVRVSSHGNWPHVHFGALEACYGNTPYFEYYADDFLKLYQTPFTFLLDLNEAFQSLVLELLGLDVDIRRTESYQKSFLPGQWDLRECIHPKHPDLFYFKPAVYYQSFSLGASFEPDLSIVDLLFNMGPESVLTLRKSLLESYA